MTSPPGLTPEIHTVEQREAGDTESSSYLLVIDDSSARRFPLPHDGVLVLGRAHDADVRIDTLAVSRKHAKIIVTAGAARVVDLGSRNGTLVNGERVVGSRLLASGDVVAVGSTTLVLRREPRVTDGAAIDVGRLRVRLEEELARAADYGRPLALAVITPGKAADHHAVAAHAIGALRRMDIVACDGTSELVVVLPELGGEAARAACVEVLAAIASTTSEARGGVATYPGDGCDAETLFSGARAAAAMSAPGAMTSAADAAVHFTIRNATIVVADPAMIRVFELIRRLARTDLPVLVLGETGVGKENAAAALHDWSARTSKPLVTLNCAAIPEALVESELFGHEKGAFSDARTAKPGLLEQASGGTVFLDEVGELPLAVQAKLLRALEAKRITRLGDVREREVDFRVVAATNRDLEAEVAAGRFRRDLLFRLGAAIVELPPLRHRPREISILARLFLAQASARARRAPLDLSETALARLAAYAFPGNVRELKNAMDFAAATVDGSVVELRALPDRIAGRTSSSSSTQSSGDTDSAADPMRRFRPLADEMRELERTRMVEALEATGGVQARAAELLAMPIRTFSFKLKQHGLSARDAKRRV